MITQSSNAVTTQNQGNPKSGAFTTDPEKLWDPGDAHMTAEGRSFSFTKDGGILPGFSALIQLKESATLYWRLRCTRPRSWVNLTLQQQYFWRQHVSQFSQ